MPVNGNRSGSRLLAALEHIAAHQPVGVRQLARMMDAEKSAVQRAIITLADAGWIHAAPGTPTRWQLTGHILHIAQLAHGSNSLRQRTRHVLEALRDATGETACLAIPDVQDFVMMDVAESRHALRIVPLIGAKVTVDDTATSLAFLAHLSSTERERLLGYAPDAALEEELRITFERGYSVNADRRDLGSVNIAAPVFESDGEPVGAILLCVPRDRAMGERRDELGAMLLEKMRELPYNGSRMRTDYRSSRD